MYFEPTKKTYYRFPSSHSVQDFDSKYYYPEKSHESGDSAHSNSSYGRYVPNRENYYDIR
jgi:hypothetical protein